MNIKNNIKNEILSKCVPENKRKIGVEIEGFYYNNFFNRLPVDKKDAFSGVNLLKDIKSKNNNAYSYSLEPGGQLEWASSPSLSLWTIQEEYNQHKKIEDKLCKSNNLNRLYLSLEPFCSPDKIKLINSTKYRLMHNLFLKAADLGPWMMRNTTSVQLNVDYCSEKDANELAFIADSIQPLLSILFSNSAFMKGDPVGEANMRWTIWENTDPARCGSLFDHGIKTLETIVDDYANWIKNLKTIFKYKPNGGAALFKGTMEEMILSDKAQLSYHILSALHQSFTHVRFKKFLEIRAIDRPSKGQELAPAAFVAGLITSNKVKNKLLDVVSNWSAAERINLIQTANSISFSNKGPEGKTVGDWLSFLSELCLEGLDDRENIYKIKNERPLIEPILNDLLINGPQTLQLQKKFKHSGLSLHNFLVESSLDSNITT